MIILTDIKKKLLINSDDFDSDILGYINLSIGVLAQLGGIEKDIEVGVDTTYEDVKITATEPTLVKEYIRMKTKFLFDPPSTGATVSAYQKEIESIEYRITL